jgi:hypothetical protein
MGEWRCVSIIPDSGTGWRRVVSSMPQSLYPWGKPPHQESCDSQKEGWALLIPCFPFSLQVSVASRMPSRYFIDSVVCRTCLQYNAFSEPFYLLSVGHKFHLNQDWETLSWSCIIFVLYSEPFAWALRLLGNCPFNQEGLVNKSLTTRLSSKGDRSLPRRPHDWQTPPFGLYSLPVTEHGMDPSYYIVLHHALWLCCTCIERWYYRMHSVSKKTPRATSQSLSTSLSYKQDCEGQSPWTYLSGKHADGDVVDILSRLHHIHFSTSQCFQK